jgi:hypothetical protein
MLSKDERIQISKKQVSIAADNAAADITKAQLESLKTSLQIKDNAHKNIIEVLNVLINAYQVEFTQYDGNARIQLTEADFTNSANKIFQNYFFPNDGATPLPSLSSGRWPNFIPFAKNIALGKKYAETYDHTNGESDLMTLISAQIVIMETYTAMGRSTGQKAIPVNQIVTDADVQTTATNIKNYVNSWKTILRGLPALVTSLDTNAGRMAENDIARNSTTPPLSTINVWLALADFDTNHGQTTEAGFNSYNVNLLQPTKFRAAELLPLKNLLVSRSSYVATRMGQLSTNLGTISQNTDGSVASSSGFYGQRFGWIDLRLNLLNGSLNATSGLERSQNAQDQIKASNNNAGTLYNTILKTVLFRASASGTSTIQVIDSTGFSSGNTVFIVGDDLDEISATIVSISANAIFLNVEIPKKYARESNSRIYKVL